MIVQREFHLRATYGMDQALIDALTQHILALMNRTSRRLSRSPSQSKSPIDAKRRLIK